MNRLLAPILGVILPVATACASCGATTSPASFRHGAGSMVLTRDDLASGWTLLESLEHRFPGLRVSSDAAPCPTLSIRGLGRPGRAHQPVIYLDGARLLDSCPLAILRGSGVESVRIVPGPAADLPGYFAGAGGTIVIESRKR